MKTSLGLPQSIVGEGGEYKTIGKIGEGTFSDVLKVQSLKGGQYYACKQMKQHFESIDHVNNLREIQALRRLNPHPNILILHEVIFDKKSGALALICELMDKNIYELIKGRKKPLPEKRIMNYMYQLFKSLDHMHRNGIFHRDVKPENILIKDLLKLGDFGSCRSIHSKQPYTEYISTRWYRAPECLLTDGYYSYKMDIWSAGCVFYEIASFHPLFPGSNELDQISKIHEIIGTPPMKVLNKFKQSRVMSFDFPIRKGKGISPFMPSLSNKSLSLIYAMIQYDPDERICAHEALQHPYFRELRWAEKQAMRRKMRLVENPLERESLNLRRIAKEDQRQNFFRQTQEYPLGLHGLPYAVELPKVTVPAVTNLTSYSNPTFQSIFALPATNRQVQLLQPITYFGTHHKSEKQKEFKSPVKQYHLPALERRGGGY
ncbi:MAPK/MAK/MRK overlapping kinase isoform X2 [Anolis carolinensis]|uniref:MAPK/MAK/MRK overlapping kinase isoform X2 n=1 Tax=Anolis carolinensis TaxID=28377 RepID=UPI000462BA70|nr:PREDICTED: MAPK/MAK/MRK overlapping kinase isoform X2 [Anolis carolinensis]|eukprot:XP_008113962.1 PREDICTED: MAPK/MAK/MRK overlapping kinase isoform X2 [Anolis carolinensis]